MKKITIKIRLPKRWISMLIIIGLLIIVGIGVYALVPGIRPEPGHLLSEFSPSSSCTAGQFLKWNGTDIICGS